VIRWLGCWLRVGGRRSWRFRGFVLGISYRLNKCLDARSTMLFLIDVMGG
jgi:hypothetical protein